MSTPFNGRIAIVDDNFEQAAPLMDLFGKLQYPYLYYRGNDLSSLPDAGKAWNDIRILFLDIFLTGDTVTSDSEKRIRSVLIGTVSRIISDTNYPYLLIYWSRHETDYGKIVEDVFDKELKAKAPIDILSVQKADYFDLGGNRTANYDTRIGDLFRRISDTISKHPVFDYLLEWENHVHQSAGGSLQKVFGLSDRTSDWDQNSQFLFYRLSRSYSGKNFDALDSAQQTRNGLFTLNSVFNDELEHSLVSKLQCNTGNKLSDGKADDPDVVYKVNTKLIFADPLTDKVSPGTVTVSSPLHHDYSRLLHSVINRVSVFSIDDHKKRIEDKLSGLKDQESIEKAKRKELKAILKEFKNEIDASSLPIEVNVTPVCDHAQLKVEYARLVPGFIVPLQYKSFIDSRTEAVFVTPDFYLDLKRGRHVLKGVYFLLVDFRFFTSVGEDELSKSVTPILRLRLQVLSEIQSKLSRHVNRQGILSVDVTV